MIEMTSYQLMTEMSNYVENYNQLLTCEFAVEQKVDNM